MTTSGRTCVAIGVGMAVGVCSTVLLMRLSSDTDQAMQKLASKVDKLQNQLRDMQRSVDRVPPPNVRPVDHSHPRTAAVASGKNQDHVASDEEEFQDTVERHLESSRLERLQNQKTIPIFSDGPIDTDVDADADAAAAAAMASPQQKQAMKAEMTRFDINRMFADADKLSEGEDQEKIEAYNMLHEVLQQKPFRDDACFLWRYAKATHNVAQIYGWKGDDESKKEMILEAYDAAHKALQLNDKNPDVHKWYAITLGSSGDYLTINEKIKNGYAFKEHIEKTIQLNPKDHAAYHLIGRWCYEVYMLSWVERKLAATLFAIPPTATIEEAKNYFLKADSLSPCPWKENMLYIAKCYIQQSQYHNAASWLKKATDIHVVSIEDRTAQKEVNALLYHYGSYAT